MAIARVSYARIPHILEMPNLIQIQKDSFQSFCERRLRELFQEVSPIKDFTGTRFELSFPSHGFGDKAEMPHLENQEQFFEYMEAAAKYPEQECHKREITFAAPLKVRAQLLVRETGEIKEQDLFMGDFPVMTKKGTFVVNGAERVVVSQLVRSPGVYFSLEEDLTTGRGLCYAKLIPDRGAWLEFETSNRDMIAVKVDRKRKIPVTTLLRAIGYGSDDELLDLFADVDHDPAHQYIRSTIDREPQVTSEQEALIDFYRRLRPGDPPTLENARSLINALFFNPRRYNLGHVGRHKLNKRLNLPIPPEYRVLTKDDLVAIVRHIILINRGVEEPDDIDHLGNRRVRAVGELLQNQIRVGLLRMERVVRERMSLLDVETATPSALVNNRPVAAAVREFFGGSQLSQFMDQTNPLAELTHKRRLSALGPGGLSRERAGFDVRDVHHSHYGRICPIETPEGPNIGLIGSLATYARVNEFGFIETPYRKVVRELPSKSPDLVGRTVREPILNRKGKTIVEAGTLITPELAKSIARLSPTTIMIKPFVSSEVQYLSADAEEKYIIAQANTRLDENSQFTEERIEVRYGKKFSLESADKIDFVDVSPKQIVSVTTSLIPFLEHDDANRALMGSNMQRQAVPLIRPQAPLVATGMEREAARDSGQVIFADMDGEVVMAKATEVTVRGELSYPLTSGYETVVGVAEAVYHGEVLAVATQGRDIVCKQRDAVVRSVTAEGIVVLGELTYPLTKFARSNQGTCMNQLPVVNKGDRVHCGQVLADSSSTEQGELALGQNVLCAFLSWEGYNFEDAVVISESLVREDRFTSIHIEKYEVEARDTKLGAEEITRDIPNVGEESLRHLDEQGIIRVGAEVTSGDILVGKITPKGERGLSAEERLLRAIFGEKAREVKDTSLRVPHGEYGRVIDVKVFSRKDRDELAPGVNQMVRVFVAQKRKICEGDKMAGRHGNKGVIARILPVEDMPFLPNGRPVDIVLSPLGVPSRMNIGQLFETHLGWAAQSLGFKVLSPVFDGATEESLEDALSRAWIAEQAGAVSGNGALEEQAKEWLAERGYDGELVFDTERTGEARHVCLRLWLEEQGIETAGLSDQDVEQEVQRLWLQQRLVPPIVGKTMLYDGRTGEPFNQPVTVGYLYMMKLIHLVENKIHARSTGPYSLITQQPLGGKAQFGGQRFGEMEVWALEAYGAAHNLQEVLTVKSDDVVGRVKTYEAIVKGEDVLEPGVPESFKVLVKELQSLGLAVEVLNEDEERVAFLKESTVEVPRLGINLTGFEGSDYSA